MYEVQTTVMDSNTSHGVQIPQVSGQSGTIIQLSLTVNSNLTSNKVYLAIITTISDDQEINSIVDIKFSMSSISIDIWG